MRPSMPWRRQLLIRASRWRNTTPFCRWHRTIPRFAKKFVSAFVLRPSSRSSSRCEGFAGATVTLQHLNTQLALGQPIDLSQHAQAVSAMVRVGSRFGLQRRHFSRQNARQRTTLGPRFCFTVPNLPIG